MFKVSDHCSVLDQSTFYQKRNSSQFCHTQLPGLVVAFHIKHLKIGSTAHNHDHECLFQTGLVSVASVHTVLYSSSRTSSRRPVSIELQ